MKTCIKINVKEKLFLLIIKYDFSKAFSIDLVEAWISTVDEANPISTRYRIVCVRKDFTRWHHYTF